MVEWPDGRRGRRPGAGAGAGTGTGSGEGAREARGGQGGWRVPKSPKGEPVARAGGRGPVASKRRHLNSIYGLLAKLLSSAEARSSEEVIDAFARRYPNKWQELGELYGDRDDIPGSKGPRRKHYARTTYLADRLVYMARRRWVELGHTDNFNHERWQHNRVMGTWCLLEDPPDAPPSEALRPITVRLDESVFARLLRDAEGKSMSVGARAAELIAGGL